MAEHSFGLGEKAVTTQGSDPAGLTAVAPTSVHFRGDLERGSDIQCAHTKGPEVHMRATYFLTTNSLTPLSPRSFHLRCRQSVKKEAQNICERAQILINSSPMIWDFCLD